MEGLYRCRARIDPLCTICKFSLETTKHVLFLYLWTFAVWFTSNLNYHMDHQAITTFDIWLLALSKVVEGGEMSLSNVLSSVSFLCWEIWKTMQASTTSSPHLSKP
ncbi:hypothetical protein ACFX2J_029986 [Malus domestica]